MRVEKSAIHFQTVLKGTPCVGRRICTTNNRGWGGLLTVNLDVAKLLTVMTLCKTNLGPICLYLDGDVAKAWQIEDIL
jgi:hypothetical protein